MVTAMIENPVTALVGPENVAVEMATLHLCQIISAPFHVSSLHDPPIPAALHIASCWPDRRKAGRLSVQGAATTGKAGIGHEVGVRAGGGVTRRDAAVAAVGGEHPAL